MAGIDEHTLLLLHGESIEDSSQYNVPLTNIGVSVSTAKSKFGGKSLYFNGNNACITAPAVKFDGEFTLDWWEWMETKPGRYGTRFGNNYKMAKLDSFTVGLDGGRVWASSEARVSGDIVKNVLMLADDFGKWIHRAVVRSGNTLTSYKNGVKEAQTAFLKNPFYEPNPNGMAIGCYRANIPVPYKGYIDEFRLSNVARWTSDFAPPDSPYTQSPAEPTEFRATNTDAERLTLKWDQSAYSERYVLERNGVQIADTIDTTYVDSVAPFKSYVYRLRAYGNGEYSRAVTIMVRATGNPLPYLITDRTAEDVASKNTKGTYNASDLNRVGEAILFVQNKLVSIGQNPIVDPKTDWADVDWMNPIQAARYLDDLRELRRQIPLKPTTPEVPERVGESSLGAGDGLDYRGANDIERILLDIFDGYLAVLSSWVAAGPATCGGEYL